MAKAIRISGIEQLVLHYSALIVGILRSTIVLVLYIVNANVTSRSALLGKILCFVNPLFLAKS